MIRKSLVLAAVAVLGLAGCKPGGMNSAPAPYANGNTAWPGANGNNNPPGYGPYNANQPGVPGGQAPYPGADPNQPTQPYQQPTGPYPQQPNQAYPQQPNTPYPQQQPSYPGANQGQPLQVTSAPQGMHRLQSQAGYVFVTQLNGSPQSSKLAMAVVQGVSGYFDGAPQVTGNQSDPQDQKTQIYFRGTLHGAPVMGVIAVNSDGQNSGIGYLLFDSPDRIQASLPIMAAATRQAPQGNNGPGGDD